MWETRDTPLFRWGFQVDQLYSYPHCRTCVLQDEETIVSSRQGEAGIAYEYGGDPGSD